MLLTFSPEQDSCPGYKTAGIESPESPPPVSTTCNAFPGSHCAFSLSSFSSPGISYSKPQICVLLHHQFPLFWVQVLRMSTIQPDLHGSPFKTCLNNHPTRVSCFPGRCWKKRKEKHLKIFLQPKLEVCNSLHNFCYCLKNCLGCFFMPTTELLVWALSHGIGISMFLGIYLHQANAWNSSEG